MKVANIPLILGQPILYFPMRILSSCSFVNNDFDMIKWGNKSGVAIPERLLATEPCSPGHLPPQEVASVGGDAGRMWGWDLPGGCHHPDGDAEDPVAGCREAG